MDDAADVVGEGSRVAVVVRVRPTLASPLNPRQRNERYEEVVCVPSSDRSLRLTDRRPTKGSRVHGFAYDRVFAMDATQEDIYEEVALDNVENVLSGTNASFLTYGQTGSGKTFTVLGRTCRTVDGGKATSAVGPDTGILLRAIQDILVFAERMRARRERHVVVGITAAEIYMDDIRDLLREEEHARPLRSIMTHDTLLIAGLTHAPLETLQDACDVYGRAASRRVQRATSANDTSSRSHAIFTVEVFQTPITQERSAPPSLHECCALRDGQQASTSAGPLQRGGAPSVRFPFLEGAANSLLDSGAAPVMYSTLTVADLAGSEKVRHAGVQGTGFEELRRINASLTALGNVVHHLHQGNRHVPYRDSILTRVLRDAFAAPRARIVLFVNVSPTVLTCEETMSSLYFADKMKCLATLNSNPAPGDAANLSAYLQSLRIHDALLAELRVFQVAQEHSTSLLHRITTLDTEHPLFQLPFHITLATDASKTSRLRRLCQRLQEDAAGEESPQVRQRRCAKASELEECQRLVREYRQKCDELCAQATEVERATRHWQAAQSDAEVAVNRALEAATADTAAASRAREELLEAVTMRAVELQRLNSADDVVQDGATEPSEASALQENDEVSFNSDAFEETKVFCEKVLELAQLRLQWTHLFRRQPLQNPLALLDAQSRRENVDRDLPENGHATDPSVVDAVPTTGRILVDAWVRRAVLVMAGNAVDQSLRRRSHQHKLQQQQQRRRKQQQQQQEGLPSEAGGALGDLTNKLTIGKRLPKYWNVCQYTAVQQSEGEGLMNAVAAADVFARTVAGGRSPFDDPALLMRITAYMDMGAPLVMLDHSGRPQCRWFCLSQKEGRLRLCWSESRRGAEGTGGGSLYLDSVTKLTLGRSSPAFRRFHHGKRQGEVGDAGTSFTVTFSSTHARDRVVRYVDVMCSDRTEMETWLVGIAHLTHVDPRFDEADTPDRHPVGNGGEAGEDGGAGDATEGALSDTECAVCRSWHIPSSVLLHTRNGIDRRRVHHRSGMMRLSPGDVRDLTGLDIFRASALWLHFEEAGWIQNPLPQLHLYVSERALEPASASGSTSVVVV